MSPGDERGSALVLSSLVVAVLVGLGVLLVVAGAVRAEGERVRGAADLVALAGAQAQAAGADGCAASAASAALNTVEVASCAVVGDEVEYVVSVEVRAPLRVGVHQEWFRARAHAGVAAPPAGP